MAKTIFITGASTGLGKATAILFSQHGWRVIASMRNQEDGQGLLQYENIRLMTLDVTKPEQIKEVANDIVKTGTLDVVFNNAGYGLLGPLEAISDDEIVREVNTNLLGVVRVTQAFIPYFREQRQGLFITTTSIGGLITFPFNSMYNATKWAIEGWSESMAYELEQFGIGIKTVSPGGIKTDFINRSLVIAKHEAYAERQQQIIDFFSNPERTQHYSTAEAIAQVVFEAATDGKEQLRYVAGDDAKGIYAQRLQLGDEIFRKNMQQLFFKK